MEKNISIRKLKKKHKESSAKWLLRQFNDMYTLEAKKLGFRSRSAFKLEQIDKKFKLLKNNINILDLGCAPGGWMQVIKRRTASNNIIGNDLLKIAPLKGTTFIQGDFTHDDVQEQILAKAANGFSLILSDIAPNTTGNKTVDHLRISYIANSVCNFADKYLLNNGNLVIKIFAGEEETKLKNRLKTHFRQVKLFKPLASRKSSWEKYIIAIDKYLV